MLGMVGEKGIGMQGPCTNQTQKGLSAAAQHAGANRLGRSLVKLSWRGCCRDTCSVTDETTAGNSALAKLGDGHKHTSQTHFPRGQTLTRMVCHEASERGSSGFSCQSPEPRDKEELLSSFSSCPYSISPSGADVSLRLL